MVPLRPYGALGEIVDGGFELNVGVFEQFETVVEGSLVEWVEVFEHLFEAAAVVGR